VRLSTSTVAACCKFDVELIPSRFERTLATGGARGSSVMSCGLPAVNCG